MIKTGRIFLVTLLVLFVLFGYSIVRAFYYLFAGVTTFGAHIYNLPQFIIPYAAIGLSLIIVTALWPLFRAFEEIIIHIVSFAAGIAAFVGFELLFEKIPALSAEKISNIYLEQALLCVAPVQKFYPGGAPEMFSPVVRLHFYVISIIIILIFIKVILDGLIAAENKKRLDKAYFIRLIAGAVLLIVCVVGNITDFFRNGSRDLPLFSVLLTVSFFILQSVVMGLFAAGFFRENYFIAPLVSVLTCILAYTGEYFVLGGFFYRLGKGAFFDGVLLPGAIINTSMAPADFIVILVSGLLSFLLCLALKPFKASGSNYGYGRGLKW